MKKGYIGLFLTLLTAISFTSCVKDNVNDLEHGDGSSFIQIIEAPENKLYFSPFTDVKKVALLTLKRDVTSPAQLNTSATFKVEMVNDSITSYNTANGTNFEPLPDSLYTFTGKGVVRSGNALTVTFEPGEFQKDIAINLNGKKWDLSHTYAVAINLVDPGGLKVSSGANEVITFLSIKNKYDGVYKITGSFTDVTNATFTAAYPLEWELQTSGPNQVIVVDNVKLGFPGFIFNASGTTTYYGTFGLIVDFDPVTDKIVSITNFHGQPAPNTRSAVLDPSGVNAYNSATKSVQIKYFMTQPSVVTAPPHIRAMFNETWQYVRER